MLRRNQRQRAPGGFRAPFPYGATDPPSSPTLGAQKSASSVTEVTPRCMGSAGFGSGGEEDRMSLRRRTVAALLCVTGLLVASSVFASGAMSSDNAGAAKATLTVSKVGTGAGLVTSVPAGITCGAVCTGQFAVGTTVELLAHGAAGSTFEAYSE